MTWVGRLSRRPRRGRVAQAAVTPQERLQRRVRSCVAVEAVGPALQSDALAEASAVLDDVAGAATGRGDMPVGAINDVALLHRLRAMGLDDAVEELHACGAAQVLAHAVEPAAIAPAVRAEVAAAVTGGAPTDVPTALLRALQGNASAVRAAWRRQQDPLLADLYVHAFQRLVATAGPDVPGHPIRLLDLSAALDTRFDSRFPAGDVGDLDQGIRLAEEVLNSATEPAIVVRAHKLLGPALATRDEVRPGGDDLARAADSFRALVGMIDPSEPQHADAQHRLAMVLRLLAGPPQPPAAD